MAEIVIFALQQANYECEHVLSAESALTALKGRKFDALVCDVNLDKKSGLDLYREVRNHKLHVGPFFFMTGQSVDWSFLSHGGLAPGPEPVIFYKPFSVSRMIAGLNQHLRGQPSVAPQRPSIPARVESAGHVVAPSEPLDLAKIRHDLCNKMMVATESVQIALLLLDRQRGDRPGGDDVSVRLQTSMQVMDEINATLDAWRTATKRSDDESN